MPGYELVLNMSENWTIWDARDVRSQVAAAVQAERAGFGGVMFSEHLVLGAGADANGTPINPREFAMPGNQHPSYPWPSSIVLMSAVAAATERVRIIGSAVLAALRHPLLLAKELGTLDLLAEGRLVVLPSVSWHDAEYRALGVPFARRGELLDELLDAMRAVWAESPVSHHGEFFDFDDVWVEPKAWRPEGPTLWFGGGSVHDRVLRRLVRHGSGLMGTGPIRPADIERVRSAFVAAGRDPAELELVSGIGGRFADATSCADLDEALGKFAARLGAGFRTFVVKPCQFIDDAKYLPEFLAEIMDKTRSIAGER
ncbi:MAG: TIGR03619 family F420-dependent LLM class oxidoreductase, partial [Ilumatobacteraceae bacterium]